MRECAPSITLSSVEPDRAALRTIIQREEVLPMSL